MALSDGDLKAITVVIKPMLDHLEENLSISTAQGFDEVHKKIDDVEERLSDKIQALSDGHDKTLDTVQQHEVRISKLEKHQV